MRFDCSPETQEVVKKTVAIDPRMIRCGMVRMGGTLREIMDVKGTVDWKRKSYRSEILSATAELRPES
jgi:hypothetical protein